MSDFENINTAPKDGSAVLLYPCGIFGAVSADIGYWDRDENAEGGQVWRTLDGERIEPLPTLWMEIPRPTFGEKQEAEIKPGNKVE